MHGCRVKGRDVPPALIGELTDSAALLGEPELLRSRLQEDGYLFLKAVLPATAVHAARREVFQRLLQVGEIAEPAAAGIATGGSRRAELEPDLGGFWKSVSETPTLRSVSHGSAIGAILSLLFGEPARPQDYMFLRAAALGRATGLHFDYPFSPAPMTRWPPSGCRLATCRSATGRWWWSKGRTSSAI